MPTSRRGLADRISAWLKRWHALLPVFAVQMIVTIGFGALLPVLPLYIQEHGIDPSGLGVIVAAWAVARRSSSVGPCGRPRRLEFMASLQACRKVIKAGLVKRASICLKVRSRDCRLRGR